MKQFLTMVAMSLILLVACEKSNEDTTTKLVINSETPVAVPFSGGECAIDFTIKNPLAEVKLTAVCGAWWISNVEVGDSKVTFVAQRNTTTEEREATIKLTYGEIEQIVEVRQGIKDGKYDFDIQATVFGGEYLGMGSSDNFNYYVQLGNAEINANNDIPEGIYYYFDIYAKYRGGDKPILPNGTYVFDKSGNCPIGCFDAEYSKAHFNDADGNPTTSFVFSNGTVTVTDNRFEAEVTMTDGTVHHIVYEGELHVPNVISSPEYGPKLTDNLSFEHTSATVRMMYYGDFYETEKAHWSISLMECQNPINGDYFNIDLITDSLENTPESVIGTYKAASDLELKDNCFIAGMIEGLKYLYSWYYVIKDDYADQSQGAPLADGTITIEKDGNDYIVTLDCVDDNGHTIKGTFNCPNCEVYDRTTSL